jgi:aspartyl-tRNA(Asn)/glutamyl-tRNA(Gln) amidotransferase subunit A
LKIFRSFKDLQDRLYNHDFSCEELVRFYLSEIKEKDNLNSFIETFNDSAIEQARIVDNDISNNERKKLSGLIVGIKDNICYANHTVTASSLILKNFKSLYSATVVRKLISEGAIIIGRLNCDEFAMGSSNENTVYGPVKNPHDSSKVPGGSSGGSAAAVAAGLCLVALGSDTGGSIRQPAAFCGAVGIKPTYSRISRYGLIAYASSFDQIGPIANNVYDASIVLEVISGHDQNDSTSSTRNIESYSKFTANVLNKKVAYITECFEHEGLDPEIKMNLTDKLEKLKIAGHVVEPVSFPFLDYLVPTYYVLSTAEASSNLSRFDGVNYGYRSSEADSLDETYINSRNEGFGDEVKRRIMLGTFVLSAGYHDAYFTKAQKIRRVLKEKIDKIFENYDFVVTPTAPHVAFPIGNEVSDPTKMYLEDIFTVVANLTGNPAISLPMYNHSSKLPYGLQIMSRRFDENNLLSFSNKFF